MIALVLLLSRWVQLAVNIGVRELFAFFPTRLAIPAALLAFFGWASASTSASASIETFEWGLLLAGWCIGFVGSVVAAKESRRPYRAFLPSYIPTILVFLCGLTADVWIFAEVVCMLFVDWDLFRKKGKGIQEESRP